MDTKILVVDDSSTSRLQVVRPLHELGYVTVEAENGDDALAKLRAHSDFVLVISDINMPWKDGMELLAEMREDEAFKALPVLMVTTEGNPAQVEAAKKLGISGWLLKPLKPEILKKAVQAVLAE